jgi:hypothetical protein
MFLGSKVRLVRKADNLTAIYEQASACYGDSFTLAFYFIRVQLV